MTALGGALLLAAGRGLRFGSDKRLQALPDGDALLVETARRYAQAFEQITVVLRPGEAHFAQMLAEALGTRAPGIVYAADAHLGMGHSLAAGARAIEDWPWVFVALADMPFVELRTLRRLRGQMTPRHIVVPVYGGRRGHPVGFAGKYLPELRELEGDAGARPVLQAHRNNVIEIIVDDPGVLRDVDRPEDLTT